MEKYDFAWMTDDDKCGTKHKYQYQCVHQPSCPIIDMLETVQNIFDISYFLQYETNNNIKMTYVTKDIKNLTYYISVSMLFVLEYYYSTDEFPHVSLTQFYVVSICN